MALLPVKHLLTTYLPTDSENRPAVGFFSRRASLRHSACLSAPPFPRLEGGHGALFWFLLLRIDFHLGEALVDLYRCPLPHLVGDMGVGVQRGGTGHMAQDGREGLNVHPVGQGVGGEGVPLRYNKDKRKKPSVFKGFSVCRCLFNSFSNLDSQRKICRMMGGVT